MSTFTYSPKYSSQVTKTPKIRTAVFGDGYEQRSADGINVTSREWSLSFTRVDSDITAIDSFLDALNGDSFDWTPPKGSAGKWICDSWATVLDTYGVETLTATFKEVFGE